MLPPDQLSDPVFGMTRKPSPIRVPLLKVTLDATSVPPRLSVPPVIFSAVVWDSVAIESVPPEMVGIPWLVRLLIELRPLDKIGVAPDGMQTLSVVPGRTVGLQLAAVCQSPPAAPTQVTLQLPVGRGVFVGVAVGVNVGVGVIVGVGVRVGVGVAVGVGVGAVVPLGVNWMARLWVTPPGVNSWPVNGAPKRPS